MELRPRATLEPYAGFPDAPGAIPAKAAGRFGLPIGSGGGAYVPPSTPQLAYPLDPVVVEVTVDTPDTITPVSGAF